MPGDRDTAAKRMIPAMPLALSVILLAVGAAYLGQSALRLAVPPSRSPAAPPENALRLLNWNLHRAYGAGDLAASVSAVVRSLYPHVVALQGLSTPDQADDIAGMLGSGWQAFSLPESAGSGRFLAILVDGRLTVTSRALPETSAPQQALALSLRAPWEETVQVICASADPISATNRRLYVEGLIEWTNFRRAHTIVLTGSLHLTSDDPTGVVDGEARSIDRATTGRLAATFSSVGPKTDDTDRLSGDRVYFLPPSLRVVDGFVVSTQRGSSESSTVSSPFVVDFLSP